MSEAKVYERDKNSLFYYDEMTTSPGVVVLIILS